MLGAVDARRARLFRYTDAENGFQYLRARYYDPATGQFISRDPLAAITQEPYGYVGGNPLNHTDPLGLAPWDWVAERADDAWDAAWEGGSVSIPEFPYTQSGVFVHAPAHLVSEAAWRPTC